MAKLFTDWRGFEIRRHSNSGGDEWDFCHYKYKMDRVNGWKPRAMRAAMEFGKSIERAAQVYTLDPSADPFDVFASDPATGWNLLKDKPLVYSADEVDWATQLQVGRELMALYKIRLPQLPILNPKMGPVFQQAIEREMFPGTALAGIKYKAILDITSFADWNHPLLPRVERGKTEFRTLITDMKCSGKMLRLETPQMICLDGQLRNYSWITGIPDVAFLWFGKSGLGLKSGLTVTLLEKAGDFVPGAEMYIADTVKCGIPAEAGKSYVTRGAFGTDSEFVSKSGKSITSLWLLPNRADVIQGLDDYCKGLKGKAYDAKYSDFLKNAGVEVAPSAVTRQRIEFFAGRVPQEMAAESGRVIAQQIAEIVDAAERNYFPKQSGIRFPNDRCSMCDYRGICIGDNGLRDALVFQPDEQFLADLAEEEGDLVQIES